MLSPCSVYLSSLGARSWDQSSLRLWPWERGVPLGWLLNPFQSFQRAICLYQPAQNPGLSGSLPSPGVLLQLRMAKGSGDTLQSASNPLLRALCSGPSSSHSSWPRICEQSDSVLTPSALGCRDRFGLPGPRNSESGSVYQETLIGFPLSTSVVQAQSTDVPGEEGLCLFQ